ncbi:peptidoglycan-N-acetylglucosamine deacetylase [Acrasis kona]|uniref:Peptidoglycan-N-acetylglucosamine deacetylase n=1 Tax=Acrasis kona TaxID=1008807 RepID=A0AAW2ZE32_9EUKA
MMISFWITILLVVIALLTGVTAAVGIAVYFQPKFIVDTLSHLFPEVLFRTNTTKKIVAITFDDGPDSDTTPQILDELAKYNSKATFFLVGSEILKENNSRLLDRMRSEGHELGNHTMYDRATIKLSKDEFTEELKSVDRLIYPEGDVTQECKLFRPGCGYFTNSMVTIAKQLGYRTVLGDIYPHDPIVKNHKINSWYVINRTHPGGIVILHDKRKHTIPALQTILPALKQKGYEIVTVSELLSNQQ